jgi:hypothetical protein
MAIAAKVGSPADEQLWYYNGLAVLHYIQLETNDSERREMTKDTNGAFPFDGSADGNTGANFGNWKITPFRDIKVLDATNHQSDSDLKAWLLGRDGDIQTSLNDMVGVHDRGGGTTEGLVAAFFDHVHDLQQTPTHLYSVYQQ